jgi:hypothetical protein
MGTQDKSEFWNLENRNIGFVDGWNSLLYLSSVSLRFILNLAVGGNYPVTYSIGMNPIASSY